MSVNYRRLSFILFSIILSWANITCDILYVWRMQEAPLYDCLIAFILIQPSIYLVYYWLYVTIPIICNEMSLPIYGIIISYLFQGPIFALVAEFKLMLTKFYYLTLVAGPESYGDRIKQDFLSHLIVHALFQSVPMGILQIITNIHQGVWDEITIVCPMISLLMAIWGFFSLTIFMKMNTGGLEWIQKKKKTTGVYTLNPLDADLTI